MKRFIIDSALILLLVMLGSSYMESDSKDLDKRLEQFDEKVEDNVLNYNSKMNKATILAKGSSEVIEDVVGISVELITNFFSAIIE